MSGIVTQELTTFALKPAVVGVTAGVIDKFFLGQNDLKSCALFGAAAAVGVAAADAAANHFGEPSIAKSIERRALEVGLAAGVALPIQYYLDPYSTRGADNAKRIGAIVAAEILGDYVANTFYFVH